MTKTERVCGNLRSAYVEKQEAARKAGDVKAYALWGDALMLLNICEQADAARCEMLGDDAFGSGFDV